MKISMVLIELLLILIKVDFQISRWDTDTWKINTSKHSLSYLLMFESLPTCLNDLLLFESLPTFLIETRDLTNPPISNSLNDYCFLVKYLVV
jgi:hypothetical protein